MDSYRQWMAGWGDYPLNLHASEEQLYGEIALRQELERRSPRLFGNDDASTNVKVAENYRSDEAFLNYELKSSDDLEHNFLKPWRQLRTDPRCRFMFIHARNSRSRLNITKAIFCQIATYHRVMPAFLDYMLPFGVQSYRRDPYGGSFHSESCFPDDEPIHRHPQLGRSGHHLEYCFSLQSVESANDSHSPWSIRMCAVWHSFDLQQDRQAWIIIKANGAIRDAIKSRNARIPLDVPDEKRSMSRALRLALETIMELAKWSVQNWHRYINSLEEKLQSRTRPALGTKIGLPVRTMPINYAGLSDPSRAPIAYDEKSSLDAQMEHRSNQKRWTIRKPFRRHRMSVSNIPEHENWSDEVVEPERTQFSFDDLQSLQGFEEKADDVSMIVLSNSEVLKRLRQEYRSLIDSSDCPLDISQQCHKDIARFERRLMGFEAEFTVLRSRMKTFSNLLQERKALLYGILQYRTMEANLEVSERSQLSTTKMEALTERMHEIAKKTQTETVSMRIITVVTLFFLPGTFISTLMSTPIVTFKHGARSISDRNISFGALEFYCAVSVPLMCCTFASWYLYHRWEKHKEKLRGEDYPNSIRGTAAAVS